MARAGRKRKVGVYREPNGNVSRVREVSRRMDGFMDDPHVIYVMEASPVIKVGFSRSPKVRVKNIQTSNGQLVRMYWYRWLDGPNAKKLEKAFHDLHRGRPGHSHGEWYYYSAADAVVKIEQLIRQSGFYSVNPIYNREVEQQYDHATRKWLPN